MMKTLLLMRHAKSSWKIQNLTDHERPLNKRGLRDAPMMGQLLVDRELVPQHIISSSAARSRQTTEGIIQSSGFKGDVQYLDRLYMAEAEEYIKVLSELPDQLERVMVIGHNPGLETLLQILSGRIESLPTAVIAHIALPVETWSKISDDTPGEMVEIWRPRELRELSEEEKEEDKKDEKVKSKPSAKAKDKDKGKEKDKGKAKGKKKDK